MPHTQADPQVELEGAVDAFWRDFVRLPSAQQVPSRQFIRRHADPAAYWVTQDADSTLAEAITLNSYLGARDDDNVVEIPAITTTIALPDSLKDSPARFSTLVHARAKDLGLPQTHYELFDPVSTSTTLIWRIAPLHRPARASSPVAWMAWKKMRFAWRMIQLKLALAFRELSFLDKDDDAELSGEPPNSSKLNNALCPLPHPGEHAMFAGLSDVYIMEAQPELPSYVVKEVSEPLSNTRYDKAAFLVLRPHSQHIPLFMMSAGAWLRSPTFLAAKEAKGEGERHPAALTQACVYRWAGYEHAQILAELRSWQASNSQAKFTDSELVKIVDWAIQKLTPGGPTKRADKRGRYAKREQVIAAVLCFLTEQQAHQPGGWRGTQKDLARGASLLSDVVVSRRTLQALLPTLRAEFGVSTTVERSGRSWNTHWTLERSYAPTRPETTMSAQAPSEPPQASIKERTSTAQRIELFAEMSGSERKTAMSLGAPRDLLSLAKPESGFFGNFAVQQASSSLSRPANFWVVSDSNSSSPLSHFDIDDQQNTSIHLKHIVRASPSLDSSRHSKQTQSHIPDAPASFVETGPPLLEPGQPPGRGVLDHLYGLGFSMIGLQPGTKVPYQERWAHAQRKRVSKSALELLTARVPETNFAIVCGAISGIVFVDLDSPEAVAWAESGGIPDTPIRVKSSPGREHWGYRHPLDAPVTTRARIRSDLAIDVRGDGGYVVAPGSIHPDGHHYKATQTWTVELLEQMPRFERRWLVEGPHLLTQRLTGERREDFEVRKARARRRAVLDGDTKKARDLSGEAKAFGEVKSTAALIELAKRLRNDEE